MNLLIVAGYTALFGGNFIGSLLDLSEKLRCRGDTVTFLFPALKNEERPWVQYVRDCGYKVFLEDESKPLDARVDDLNEILSGREIDLMHLHFGALQQILRKQSKQIKPVKIVIHDHMGYSIDSSVWKQRAYQAAYSALYARLGCGMITVMKQKKDAYVFMKKKWYIPNGLSLRRNVDHFAGREETRKELGIREDECLCTMFGWSMKLKGVDTAVKAISMLRDRGSNVILGLIGGRPERYAEFIRSYGIDPDSPWIHYLGSREDVFSLHRAADVFMSLSRSEGFPYGVLEAISQNDPIVISDIPQTSWAMEYKKASVFPTEDPAACAEAILQAAAYGTASSNSDEIIERFSIDRWCDSVIGVFDWMMER